MTGCNKNEKTVLPDMPSEVQGDQLQAALEQDQALLESAKEDLLKSYTFYTGVATVLEEQSWVSKYQDGTHGEGDATFISLDYLVYDPLTDQCYILARDLTYRSEHTVTVNDMQGAYISTGYVNAFGELSEYYGTGLITRKETTDASASQTPTYLLNFSANPVRIDAIANQILTLPPTLNMQWVAYTSTADTVRLGVERVLPPDGALNESIDLIPNLSNLSDTKTYGNRESRVYEATTRIWNVKGTFTYTYRQIGYEEAINAIQQIRQEAIEEELYQALAQNLPEPWQETARVADRLDNISDASARAGSILNELVSSGANANSSPKQAVEIMALNPDFQDAVKSIQQIIEDARADQGALRSLDGAIINASAENNSGTQQQKIRESYSEVKLLLAEVFSEYETLYAQMQKNLNALKAFAPQGNTMDAQKIQSLLEDCMIQSKKAAQLNQKVQALFEDLYTILSDLNALQTVNKETAYQSLNDLYALWPETAASFTGGNVSVDINQGTTAPSDYPSDVVPLLKDGIIAISEKIPGESGSADGFMITLKTNLSAEEVLNYYKTALKAAANLENFSAGGMTVLSGSKDGYELSVMITSNSLGGTEKTMVQIALTPEE
jgi:hypothetical protein